MMMIALIAISFQEQKENGIPTELVALMLGPVI